MASIRYVPNRSGVENLLNGPKMMGLVARYGARIQAATNHVIKVSDGLLPVELRLAPGKIRARAAVIANHPAGIAAENKYHFLELAAVASGADFKRSHSLRGQARKNRKRISQAIRRKTRRKRS